MAIKFTTNAVFFGSSERTKPDGMKYAVLTVVFKSRAFERSKVKFMCFAPVIYKALQMQQRYQWEGIVTFSQGNTFLTVTDVYLDGKRVYTEPEEDDIPF